MFILRITVQKAVAMVIVLLPLRFAGFGDTHPVAESDFSLTQQLWPVALALLLVAPVVETLVLQSVPIEIGRMLRQSRLVQFVLGAVPFAALHFRMGITVGIAAAVSGFFLSHAYLEGRERSLWAAVWITMVIHVIHNLICLAALLAAAWIGE